MRAFHVIGSCVLFVLISGCTSESEEPSSSATSVYGDAVSFADDSPPVSVETAAVTLANSEPLTLTGRMVWNEDRTVHVFARYGGRVMQIAAKPGDHVKAGQILATLASPEYGSAQADHRKALAARELAQHNLERARDLQEHGVIAIKELQAAEADAAAADAEAARTAQLLSLFGDHGAAIDQHVALRSPIGGEVVARAINPGQELLPDQSGAAPFVITDMSSLWVELDAREEDLSLLKPGMKLQLQTKAYPNETFEGAVLRTADYVDPVSRTIKVLAQVPNKDHRLKGELFVTATIPTDASQQAEAPATAVVLLGEKHFTFVKEGPSFVRREVEVGAAHSGKVAILSGVKPGEELVTQGALFLQQTLQTHAQS